MKKLMTILKIIWNIISVIIMTILKLIALCLYLPALLLSEVSILFGAIMITLFRIVAGLFLVLFIVALIEHEFNWIFFVCFLISGFVPELLTYGAAFITSGIYSFLRDIISYYSFTEWTIPLSGMRRSNYTYSQHHYYEGESFSNNSNTDQYSEPSQEIPPDTGFDLFAGVTSETDLKKRYRELLKIYHPDNSSGDTAMSQKIQEAYQQILAEHNWKSQI